MTSRCPAVLSSSSSSIALIALLVLLPVHTGLAVAAATTVDNSKYDVIVAQNAEVSAILYLVSDDNGLFLVPLGDVIGANCSIKDTVYLVGGRTLNLIGGGYVNFTLPNGSEIRVLNFEIANYPGCGRERPEIRLISTEYQTVWTPTMDVTVHVLVPPPKNNNTYALPSILYADVIMIIYRYINETHFGVDIRLYWSGYNDLTFYNSREYNITVRFVVDENSWNAKYWNGSHWIPAGVLPIAGPDLDIVGMLYKFYASYNNTVNYYLTHRDQLTTLLDKLKTLFENNETDEAKTLIQKLTSAPLPQEWRKYKVVYLGKNYTLHPLSGEAVSQILELRFPAYTWVTVRPNLIDFKNNEEELMKAVIDYLVNGSINALENIIVSYNSFVFYEPVYHDGGNGSLMLVYRSSVLPAFGGVVNLPLPVESLLGAPEIAGNAEYAILDLETALTINSEGVEIFRNTTIPSPPSEQELGNNGYLVVAIDTRLAQEWMLTSNKSLSPYLRENILLNLLNVVVNNYYKTWYDMINGEDPEKALGEFQSFLRTAVLGAALQLGGKAGEELLMKLISRPATPGSAGNEENGAGSPSGAGAGNTSQVPTSTSAPGGTVTPVDRGLFVIAGAGVALIAVAVAILVVGSRRHR